MDDGSNSSLIFKPAATRQVAGRNNPVGQIVAPESVPPPGASMIVPRQRRRHQSSTPGQGRRAATPPINPRKRSRIPPVPLEHTPVSQLVSEGAVEGAHLLLSEEGSICISKGRVNQGSECGRVQWRPRRQQCRSVFDELSNINFPILSQILIKASRPKFQGTAVHFSEFCRQWGEFHKLFRSTFLSIGETQFFQFKDMPRPCNCTAVTEGA
jgi:hypothetical protein